MSFENNSSPEFVDLFSQDSNEKNVPATDTETVQLSKKSKKSHFDEQSLKEINEGFKPLPWEGDSFNPNLLSPWYKRPPVEEYKFPFELEREKKFYEPKLPQGYKFPFELEERKKKRKKPKKKVYSSSESSDSESMEKKKKKKKKIVIITSSSSDEDIQIVSDKKIKKKKKDEYFEENSSEEELDYETKNLWEEKVIGFYHERSNIGKDGTKGSLLKKSIASFLKERNKKHVSFSAPDFPTINTILYFNASFKKCKVKHYSDASGNWGPAADNNGTKNLYQKIDKHFFDLKTFKKECKATNIKWEDYVIEKPSHFMLKIKKRNFVFDPIPEGIPKRIVHVFGPRMLIFWFVESKNNNTEWKKWKVAPHGNFRGKTADSTYNRITVTQKKRIRELIKNGENTKTITQKQFTTYNDSLDSFDIVKKNAIYHQQKKVKQEKEKKIMGDADNYCDFLKNESLKEEKYRIVHNLTINSPDISFCLTTPFLLKHGVNVAQQRDCKPIGIDETFGLLREDIRVIPIYSKSPFQKGEPCYVIALFCSTKFDSDSLMHAFAGLEKLSKLWCKKSIYNTKYWQTDADFASEKVIEMMRKLSSKNLRHNKLNGRWHFKKTLLEKIQKYGVGLEKEKKETYFNQFIDFKDGVLSQGIEHFNNNICEVSKILGVKGEESELHMSVMNFLKKNDRIHSLCSNTHEKAGLNKFHIGTENYIEWSHRTEIKSLLRGKVSIPVFIERIKIALKGNEGKIKAAILGENKENPLKKRYKHNRVFHKKFVLEVMDDLFRSGDSKSQNEMLEKLKCNGWNDYFEESKLDILCKDACVTMCLENSCVEIDKNIMWAVKDKTLGSCVTVRKSKDSFLSCSCQNQRKDSVPCFHLFVVLFREHNNFFEEEISKTKAYLSSNVNKWIEKKTGKFLTEKKNKQKQKKRQRNKNKVVVIGDLISSKQKKNIVNSFLKNENAETEKISTQRDSKNISPEKKLLKSHNDSTQHKQPETIDIFLSAEMLARYGEKIQKEGIVTACGKTAFFFEGLSRCDCIWSKKGKCKNFFVDDIDGIVFVNSKKKVIRSMCEDCVKKSLCSCGCKSKLNLSNVDVCISCNQSFLSSCLNSQGICKNCS